MRVPYFRLISMQINELSVWLVFFLVMMIRNIIYKYVYMAWLEMLLTCRTICDIFNRNVVTKLVIFKFRYVCLVWSSYI